MANTKLKRLKIDQYRNVAPGTELMFNDTWNVLLGQNGTGKTTLLNLIAMVVASDFSPLKDEPFAIEYELTYTGAASVVVHLKNLRQAGAAERPREGFDPAIGGTLELSPAQGELLSWLCTVTIRFEGSPACWEVSLSPSAARKKRSVDTESSETVRIVNPFERRFLRGILDLLRWEKFDENLTRAWVAAIRAQIDADLNAARFDEGLGIFHAITGAQSAPERENLRSSRVTVEKPPDAARKAPQFAISQSGIVPPAVLAHIMAHESQIRPTKESGEEDAFAAQFMERTAAALGLSRVELTWDLLKKEVGQQTERFTFGNFGFKLTLDDGSIINHDLLSYGQKRLLAFLYYIAANSEIVIADELVNGLHYDWIEVCLKEIGDRQSFLTSQNPLLLDFLPFASLVDVQRSFLLCRREKRDKKGQMVWTNLDEESARSFFRAYETEAQQVSEILRSKGLW